MKALVVVFLSLFFLLIEVGCGGAGSSAPVVSDPSPITQTPPPPPIPRVGHVALLVFENQKEDKILNNPNMPYLSGLAMQNAYASQYYANVHPSLGNYFMLTTGQIISNDLNFSGVVDVDNLIRELVKSGRSWKGYQESIPSTAYLGDGPLPYVKTHNPAAYFSDVRNDPAQAANMVSLDQLQTDLTAGNVPDFMFVEPNQVNSMHDCPATLPPTCTNDQKLGVGDAWAAQYVGMLINNPTFQQDGLIIITWDESWDTDSQNGGGRVLTILIGPKVKKQYVSTTFYQHESVLNTICGAMNITCMGNAVAAPSMKEFFVGN